MTISAINVELNANDIKGMIAELIKELCISKLNIANGELSVEGEYKTTFIGFNSTTDFSAKCSVEGIYDDYLKLRFSIKGRGIFDSIKISIGSKTGFLDKNIEDGMIVIEDGHISVNLKKILAKVPINLRVENAAIVGNVIKLTIKEVCIDIKDILKTAMK